jgi:hypothetical protein
MLVVAAVVLTQEDKTQMVDAVAAEMPDLVLI